MQKKLTKKLTTIAILSAISVVLSFIEVPLPGFPPFLKVDLADLPALIGTIMFGLDVGILVSLIRNIVSAIVTNTSGGIGEFVNFVVCVSFILPFAFVYKKNKTTKSFILSASLGVLLMTLVASLLNYYVTIPLYIALFGFKVDSIKDFIIIAIAPFNLIKGLIVSTFSYLVVTRLKKFN